MSFIRYWIAMVALHIHPKNRKAQPMANLFSGLREDLERVIEDHETEIGAALSGAAKLADSKTAQVALSFAHIPPSVDALIAEFLQELDNEVGKLAPPAPETSAPAAETPAA